MQREIRERGAHTATTGRFIPFVTFTGVITFRFKPFYSDKEFQGVSKRRLWDRRTIFVKGGWRRDCEYAQEVDLSECYPGRERRPWGVEIVAQIPEGSCVDVPSVGKIGQGDIESQISDADVRPIYELRMSG